MFLDCWDKTVLFRLNQHKCHLGKQSSSPASLALGLLLTAAMEKATGTRDANAVFRDGHPELTLGSYRPAPSLPVRWLSRFLESQMTWMTVKTENTACHTEREPSPTGVGGFLFKRVGFGSFQSSGRWMRSPLNCMYSHSPPGTLHSLWELSQVTVPTRVPHHRRIHWAMPGQSNYAIRFYFISIFLLHPCNNIFNVYFIF